MLFRSSAQHMYRSASWCHRHLPSSWPRSTHSERFMSSKSKFQSKILISKKGFLWHLNFFWLLPRTWHTWQKSNQNKISSYSISLWVVSSKVALWLWNAEWLCWQRLSHEPSTKRLARTRHVICTAVWVFSFFRSAGSTAGRSKTHGSAVIAEHECRHHVAATWLVDLEGVKAHPVSGQSCWLLSTMIRSILLGFTISVR